MTISLDIHPKMQSEQAFRAIAHDCVDRFLHYLPSLRQNWDTEALHQARVSLRRLVAAMTLFRKMVEDKRYERLRERVKALTRTLGEARNLDVFLDAADPEMQSLRGTVSLLRSQAYAKAIERLDDPLYRHLPKDLLDWIDAGPWRKRRKSLRERRLDDFAAKRLDRKWRQFRRQSRKIDALSPPDRHHVRIAGKKLRYALEFLAPLAQGGKRRKRRDRLVGRLKALQDMLGQLNDVETGRVLGRTMARRSRRVAYSAGRLVGAEEARTVPLLKRAAKAARDLRERKPFWH